MLHFRTGSSVFQAFASLVSWLLYGNAVAGFQPGTYAGCRKGGGTKHSRT